MSGARRRDPLPDPEIMLRLGRAASTLNKNLLSTHAATPDALVPLFETLAAQFPDVA